MPAETQQEKREIIEPSTGTQSNRPGVYRIACGTLAAVALVLAVSWLAGIGDREKAIQSRIEAAREQMSRDTYAGYTGALNDLKRVLNWREDHVMALALSAKAEAILHDSIDPDFRRRERAEGLLSSPAFEGTPPLEAVLASYIIASDSDRSDIAGQVLEKIETGAGSCTLHYIAALHLAEDGDGEAAEQHLREALKIRPGYTRATMVLARRLQKLDRPEEALRLFVEVGERHPSHGRARVEAALARLDLGYEPEKSLKPIRELERYKWNDLSEHERLRAELALAKILHETGDTASAIERLLGALEIHEETAEPAVQLARVHLDEMNLVAAREAVLDALARDANHQGARRVQAEILLAWGRHKESIQALDTLDGPGAEDYLLRGVSSFHAGDYRTAIEALSRAKEDPLDRRRETKAEVYLALARLKTGQQRHPRELSVSAEDEQGGALTDWGLGRWYALQGDTSLAKRHFAKALEQDADCYRTLTDLARLEARAGNYDAALEHLTKASEVNPYFTESLLAKGETLLSVDRPEGAATWFRRILDHWPDEPSANSGLALALLRLGDLHAAAFHADTAVEHGREESLSHYALGRVLLERGKTSEAIASFVQARRRDPEVPSILIGLAEAHLERGLAADPDHARRYLEQALSKDEASVTARQMLAELDD